VAGGINLTLRGIADLTSAIKVPVANEKKQLSAARDFEALLIGQMLRSMHEDGASWLGAGDDDAGATALAYGEDQLARALANSGGLGLSKIIASGLAAKSAQSQKTGT